MKEERKKISLLTNLYNILFDNDYINNEIFEYEFYSISNLIINSINFDVFNKIVKIILLDELVIEVYNNTNCQQIYSIPYYLIDDIYILLEE